MAIFAKLEPTARRQAAYAECEALNAGLEKEGRKADIVAVLDATGKVLARDLNLNAMFGEDMRAKFPAVGTALQGEAVKDIWTLQNRMNRVAVAPITPADGTIRGALLIGYVLTARDAQLKRDQLGTEIALLPRRQGAHVELRLRGHGRTRKGGRQQDAGAERGAPSARRKLAEQALQKGAPDRGRAPDASTGASTRAWRRRCTATSPTRPAAS